MRLKSKGGQRELESREGEERAGTSPPSLLPWKHHGFTLWLALGTMGREASGALRLHVKGVLMEGMCHGAGLGAQDTMKGLRASFLSIRAVSIFSVISISTYKYLNE